MRLSGTHTAGRKGGLEASILSLFPASHFPLSEHQSVLFQVLLKLFYTLYLQTNIMFYILKCYLFIKRDRLKKQNTGVLSHLLIHSPLVPATAETAWHSSGFPGGWQRSNYLDSIACCLPARVKLEPDPNPGTLT